MPKKQPKYNPPFIECDFHEGPQRSYAICKCVMEYKEPVAAVDPASDTEIGGIACSADHRKMPVEHYRLICEGCAIQRGFVRAPGSNIVPTHKKFNELKKS